MPLAWESPMTCPLVGRSTAYLSVARLYPVPVGLFAKSEHVLTVSAATRVRACGAWNAQKEKDGVFRARSRAMCGVIPSRADSSPSSPPLTSSPPSRPPSSHLHPFWCLHRLQSRQPNAKLYLSPVERRVRWGRRWTEEVPCMLPAWYGHLRSVALN